MATDQFSDPWRAADRPHRATLPAPDREGVARRHHPGASRRVVPVARRVDLQPGGALHFGAFDGDAAATARSRSSDPPRLLASRWGTDRLTFELAPAGDGTAFALTHSFDDRAGAASFATGWELCLAGLRHVLADEPVPATGPRGGPARGAGRGVRAGSAGGHRGRWPLDGPLRAAADLPGPGRLGPVVRHRPGHRRAAPGAGGRRAVDSVHGARARDRHDDRGRRAAADGVRRHARGWAG